VSRAYLEADAPRVTCKVHGVTVAEVPWARHAVGFTRTFEDQVAWLAVHCSKSAIEKLMRIAWRTVGAIVARVCDDARALRDPLDGLRRIGIDEVSYLPQGPPVSDGRGRSRHRPAGVGVAGPGQGHRQPVLQRARPVENLEGPAGIGGCGPLDR
jgi:hypothetical protein